MDSIRDNKMCQLEALQAVQLTDSNFINNEFSELNLRTNQQLAESPEYQSSIKLSIANYFKNRYTNIFCLERTRVKLRAYQDHDLENDYINANYIDGLRLGSEKFYIATQAPLLETMIHFWLMVWEHNSSIIAMLTRLNERGLPKADQYWPSKVEGTCHIGSFSVTLQSEKKIGEHLICRTILLQLFSKSRTIHHFQYLEWPDSGRPVSTKTIRRLVDRVNKLPKKGPLIVHCSAGVGRAGTFISILLCLNEIRLGRNFEKINVPQIVTHLRNQRFLMVQSLEQYQFIYDVIRDEETRIQLSRTNRLSKSSQSSKSSRGKVNSGHMILSLSAPPHLPSVSRSKSYKGKIPHYLHRTKSSQSLEVIVN